MKRTIKKVVLNSFELIINYIIPRFILILFFRLFLFKKNHNLVFNNNINNINSCNQILDRDLLYLDYFGAVGDFVILLRTIIELYNEGYQFDILVHIKMKGILEKLNLKGINIIYKYNDMGVHYIPKYKNNYQQIYNESLKKNLSYNRIYYFNKRLNMDAFLYIMNIKYNHLIMMKDITDKINKNKLYTFYWGVKNKNFLPFFAFVNEKKMKILEVGNKKVDGKKNKDLSLADFAYFIYTGKMPKYKLFDKNYSNYFTFSRKIIKNSLCVMLDRNPRKKSLKMDYLIDYIKRNYNDKIIVLVGNSVKQSTILEKKIDNKVINLVDKTKNIKELMNYIDMCESVLAYDSCILHIATILNKNVLLINNKDRHIYKKAHGLWMSYSNIKEVLFSDKYFMEIDGE